MKDKVNVNVQCTGPLWFVGWLFTIAFARLDLLESLLGILVWPWYLGVALR